MYTFLLEIHSFYSRYFIILRPEGTQLRTVNYENILNLFSCHASGFLGDTVGRNGSGKRENTHEKNLA